MQPLNGVRERVLKQVAFKRDLEEGQGQRSKPEHSQCKSPAVEKTLTFHQLSREHAGTKTCPCWDHPSSSGENTDVSSL